jgi:hypothetical protein
MSTRVANNGDRREGPIWCSPRHVAHFSAQPSLQGSPLRHSWEKSDHPDATIYATTNSGGTFTPTTGRFNVGHCPGYIPNLFARSRVGNSLIPYCTADLPSSHRLSALTHLIALGEQCGEESFPGDTGLARSSSTARWCWVHQSCDCRFLREIRASLA